MRKIVIGILSFLAIGICNAAPKAVKITPMEGAPMIFEFSSEPELSFLAGNLNVKTSDKEPVEIRLDNIQDISFEEEVGTAEIPESTIRVRVVGDEIVFSGIPADTQVAVCDLQGKTVALGTSGDGTYSILKSSLDKGVYVVRIGAASFKILI